MTFEWYLNHSFQLLIWWYCSFFFTSLKYFFSALFWHNFDNFLEYCWYVAFLCCCCLTRFRADLRKYLFRWLINVSSLQIGDQICLLMQPLVCLWRCYLCNTLVSTSIVMQSDFEYISLNHLHFCSPQISFRLKAVRSTGSDAACGASSRRAAGLHPGHRHGGRTRLGDLCPLQAQPLFTDWQTGLPSHPHPQLQRHSLLPQLAGSIDQVQIHAHMLITEWVDMSR